MTINSLIHDYHYRICLTVPEPTSVQPTPPSYTVLPAAASRPAGAVTHGSNLPSHQQSASTTGTAVYAHYVVDLTLFYHVQLMTNQHIIS